jgi:uncharacterized protein (TIGR02266 family)
MFLKKAKPAMADLSALEAAASKREAALCAEVEKARAQAAKVSEQVQSTRAAMIEAEKLGVEDASLRMRLEKLELPRPDASAMLSEVDHAMRAALAVREGAADELTAQLSQWKQTLEQQAKQLEHDQAAIRKAYESAREARVRAVEESEQATAKTMITPRPKPESSGVVLGKMKPKPGPEGRQAKRVPMQAQIDFGSDSNFFSGFSTNISDGGVFIATVNVLPLGTHIDLSFTLPSGSQVQTKGVVRWVREVNDKIPDAFPGIGVQFEELPEEAHDAIHGFVAEREPMFYPE